MSYIINLIKNILKKTITKNLWSCPPTPKSPKYIKKGVCDYSVYGYLILEIIFNILKKNIYLVKIKK